MNSVCKQNNQKQEYIYNINWIVFFLLLNALFIIMKNVERAFYLHMILRQDIFFIYHYIGYRLKNCTLTPASLDSRKIAIYDQDVSCNSNPTFITN